VNTRISVAAVGALVTCLGAAGTLGVVTLPASAQAAAAPTAITPAAVSTSALADRLVMAPVVGSGSRLPAVPGLTVTWTASGPASVSDGRVVATTAGTSQLTAAWNDGSASGTKTFSVEVLPAATSTSVVSYTRRDTGSANVNQDVVAYSMHLAVGDDPTRAVPVNGGYGVLFGSGVSVGVDRIETRTLAAPALYHRAKGDYGVVALRMRRDGSSDGSDASQVVVYTTPDLVHYSQPVLVDLGSTSGVRSPRAVHDSASGLDVLTWTDSSGQARWASFGDLADPTSRVATGLGAVDTGTAPPASVEIGDAVPASTLAVDDSALTAVQGRFGRIRNTAVSVAPKAVTTGSALDLSATRAQLSYSDGSTASRAITWDPDDLAAVDTSRPGSYTVRGTVRAPAYAAPFIDDRADPTVYRYERDGKTQYLFIATDDNGGNNIGSVHLPIRGASTIAGLRSAPEVDLLNRVDGTAEKNTQGKTIAGCYWAPELHEIGGKLTILFSPCFNRNGTSNDGPDWQTVQSHVMQLRTGGDPLNPADWSQPAPVLQADGVTPLQRDNRRGISLDMSWFVVGGQAYYTWSQRYVEDGLSDPATWIAKMDPSDPTRITSKPVPIIVPETSWEEQLSEGAFALVHGGRVHLVYSSSGVSPTYVVGGASAAVGSDLTDPASWTKEDAPLQRSTPLGNSFRQSEQGPGHGAFTTDEDGNLLYVFHTFDNGGRDARLRRAHWAADGHLVLDMTLAEEVAPDLRRVRTTVVVGATTSTTSVSSFSATSEPAAAAAAAEESRAPSALQVRSTGTGTAVVLLRVAARTPGGVLKIRVGNRFRVVKVRSERTRVRLVVRPGERIRARYTGSRAAAPAQAQQRLG
jgi:GH43 family beta-xylosidase